MGYILGKIVHLTYLRITPGFVVWRKGLTGLNPCCRVYLQVLGASGFQPVAPKRALKDG